MKPRPPSFSHHLLSFLFPLSSPPFSGPLPLHPHLLYCLLPDRADREGREESERLCRSVGLFSSFSLSDVAWVAAAVPPTFPPPLLQSSPGWFTRRFTARCCHCADRPTDRPTSWDTSCDMSLNTMGATGTLFYVLQMIISSRCCVEVSCIESVTENLASILFDARAAEL